MNLIRLAKMEIKLLMRDRLSAFWSFIFPVIMLWLIGTLYQGVTVSGPSYIQTYAPAWIGINMTTIALFTIGVTITAHREQGVLLRYQATPLSAATILSSYFLCGAFIFTISFLLIFIEGVVLYGLNFPKYPFSTLIVLILSLMTMFSFGLFINSLTKSPRQSATVSSAVLNLMLLLSGATIPIDLLPTWLSFVTKALPLYYVIETLRGTWLRAPIIDMMPNVVVLLSLFVLFSSLAIRTFRWNSLTP